MSQNKDNYTAMVQGRIVWVAGDLFKGRQKLDQNTRQPRLDKSGNPAMEYGFGLSVPKAELAQGKTGADLWSAMHNAAFSLYPSRQLPQGFAMKYKDGDTVDDKGVPFAQRKGYQGCLVFALTTSLPIKFFRWENGQPIQINEGIKCGDYVQVQVSVKPHPAAGTARAGLYLNPTAVLFLGYGEEIVNAPSGSQIFGSTAPSLPPGASATPLGQPGFATVMGAAMSQPTGQAFGQPQQPTPQQAPVAPHYAVLPQAYQPVQPDQQQVPQSPGPAGFPTMPAVPGYPQQ